jgi:DNA end-binding protein Ku
MKDGEEVADGDIVRAAEYDGRYVELSDKELERSSDFERDIVVRQITTIDTIAPLYYDTPYYLVPDDGGELAYAIFRRAFEKTTKVAIATFLFYGRERLCVISVKDGVLQLQTLRFEEDILSKSDIPVPAIPQPSPAQIALASRLFEQYDLPFHASDYRNQQTDILNELIERKAKGLSPKKHQRVSMNATPENEVVQKIKDMVEGDPRALMP